MSWLKKVKRRRGGVYLWRVDHHINRARRVNGYVGETVSFHFRSRQHMGTSHYAVEGGKRVATAVKVPSQPWSDLRPKMYKIIPLPWWLCWKWVLRPLETLAILVLWPRYNDAKNRWNPRRITTEAARVARMERDNGWVVQRYRIVLAHLVRTVSLSIGAVVFLAVAALVVKVAAHS